MSVDHYSLSNAFRYVGLETSSKKRKQDFLIFTPFLVYLIRPYFLKLLLGERFYVVANEVFIIKHIDDRGNKHPIF